METATHSTTSSQLPTALTARILQQIPQRQRLTCCSRVCRAWRDAAAQATVHIECTLTSATTQRFDSWLRQHAWQVKTLKATGKRASVIVVTELPLRRMAVLQSLSLSHLSVAYSAFPSGSYFGSNDAPLLPHLQELHLTACTLDIGVLPQLASNSPQLTSLVVDDCCTTHERVPLSHVLARALRQWPGLVVLRLPAECLADARTVAAMPSLRELQVGTFSDSLNYDKLPKLPAQLPFGQLLHLHASCCTLTVEALGSMPQLQHLHLYGCGLLPCHPDLTINITGTAVLLQTLPALTSLRHLHLEHTGLYTDAGVPEQWAALTASTHLTHLFVMEEETAPLLEGAAQHMWPAGRRLPHLQHLTLQSYGSEQMSWCLTGADLASIVAACPGLRELDVLRTVKEGADVSPLLRLPSSFTSLQIGGDSFADNAVPVLHKLTQLQRLEWEGSEVLTDLDVLRFTALQALTRLVFAKCWRVSESLWRPEPGSDSEQAIVLQSGDTEGPVCEQLQALCDYSPECVAATRQQLQAELESLQQQLAASEEQVAQTQAQVTASTTRVQQLQQELQLPAAPGGSVGGGQ